MCRDDSLLVAWLIIVKTLVTPTPPTRKTDGTASSWGNTQEPKGPSILTTEPNGILIRLFLNPLFEFLKVQHILLSSSFNVYTMEKARLLPRTSGYISSGRTTQTYC